MKVRTALLSTLTFMSFNTFSQSLIIGQSNLTPSPNTKIYAHSSENHNLNANQFKRKSAYPTQIVRTQGNIRDAKVSCDAVDDRIEKAFEDEISPDLFFYNNFIACIYDQKTELATEFVINSYFDPLSDDAIKYYEEIKSNIEGQSIFGVPLHIENAQGLIISLQTFVGTKASIEDTGLQMLREDSTSYYYANNYDMMKAMVIDIKKRFHGKDPKTILPFMDHWFYEGMGVIYDYALRASNYIELNPERIFLMDEAPKNFLSMFRYKYGRYCLDTPNGHCL